MNETKQQRDTRLSAIYAIHGIAYEPNRTTYPSLADIILETVKRTTIEHSSMVDGILADCGRLNLKRRKND